ncbi:MAG: Gfo/Idh/MocA family oxidoreductase [Candidatus Marinimicrobia bacterium]|nr:Gfo/Idh/MocA family oxidoreductase [Candidatus Neomarinimicrobiota bacterium]
MSRRVRMGVVGVGSLGQHHARIYAELPQVELVGLYDADAARVAEVAARHGARVYPDPVALAADCEAVSVAVPTDRHRAVAGALIESGLHVLVEKPLAATTREAEELVALAQARNVILQVGHVERFNPVLAYLEEALKHPRFIEAHRLAPYPPVRPGLPPRGTEVSVVLDLMIHDLEIILHLVGAPVTEIRAVGVPVLSPTEDIANVRLQFANGCVANITASRISAERLRKIRVFQDDAYLSLDYQAQSGEIHRRTATGITRETIPLEPGEPLALELAAYAECVLRRDQPRVSGEHAADALRLAARILAALHEGAA